MRKKLPVVRHPQGRRYEPVIIFFWRSRKIHEFSGLNPTIIGFNLYNPIGSCWSCTLNQSCIFTLPPHFYSANTDFPTTNNEKERLKFHSSFGIILRRVLIVFCCSANNPRNSFISIEFSSLISLKRSSIDAFSSER